MGKDAFTVGFDIGGTNLRGAVVDQAGTILSLEQLPTPSSQAGLYTGIKTLVQRFTQQYPIAAVGVAIAGFLDETCRTVRFAPHLSWRNEPVAANLERELALPVVIEHDANSAAWGEYRFGSARDVDNWVLFAIGTGIGGALMTGGKLYRGAFGTAPEFGHLRVLPHGRSCKCGKTGCLETYCSGTALAVTAAEVLSSNQYPDSCLLPLYNQDPAQVTGRAVVKAARHGDAAGKAIIADFANWLGQGLALVADILDPEQIVIGGGLAGEADLYLEQAVARYRQEIVGAGFRPEARVVTAQLGANAGMIGVADLARAAVSDVCLVQGTAVHR